MSEKLKKFKDLIFSLHRAQTLNSVQNSVSGFYYYFGVDTILVKEISYLIFVIKCLSRPSHFKLFVLSILLCLSFQTKTNIQNKMTYNYDYDLMQEICEIIENEMIECDPPKYVSEIDEAIILNDEQGYREFCLLHGDPVYLMEFDRIKENMIECRYVEISNTRLRKSRGFISQEKLEENNENF